MIDPREDREKIRNTGPARSKYRELVNMEERWCACLQEVVKKFGDRLHEYDLFQIEPYAEILKPKELRNSDSDYSSPFPDVELPQEQRYFAHALKKAKNPKDRLRVQCGTTFPLITSPSFANQMGYQIQALIEKEMEIEKLHKFPRTEVVLFPFGIRNIFTPINDEIFQMNEKIDGVWYTQFLFSLDFCHPELWGEFRVHFWGRCYSPIHPEAPVDVCQEHTSDTVRFEITDAPPPSVCPYDQLPELLQQYDPFMGNYKEVYEYDPQRWRLALKKMINTVVEIEKKRSEERKKRREEEKRLRAEGKPIPKKLRWYMNPSFYQSFPDATFRLRFISPVTDEKISLLREIVFQLNQELGDNGIEHCDFERKESKECLMVLDFGIGDGSAVDRLIESINRSELDIRSATIE